MIRRLGNFVAVFIEAACICTLALAAVFALTSVVDGVRHVA